MTWGPGGVLKMWGHSVFQGILGDPKGVKNFILAKLGISAGNAGDWPNVCRDGRC